MAEVIDRDLHLVKKALAIAILAIERQLGPLQSVSDQTDMKSLLSMTSIFLSKSSSCHFETRW